MQPASLDHESDNTRKRVVSYFHDNDFGQYYFGPNHFMKPFRASLTFELVLNYGLHEDMSIYNPELLSHAEMTKFHTKEYVDFLEKISPSNATFEESNEFNIGTEDCPAVVDIFPYCQRSCGGTVTGAAHLISGHADLAINWMGGMHHAKRSEASGFCYSNDIVLGILELLKFIPRVLYVDIDIHHGDGVEEAFLTTDRVMTVSFHKYGDHFFPETGALEDVGVDTGAGYAVNVPLNDGMDDPSYTFLFKRVISDVMEHFRPGAIVLQCGADSLANDRLGCFNLSIAGHGECVSFVKSFNIPTMLVGGGGYTMRNCARCWAYETALCVNKTLPAGIPNNLYYDYYTPDYSLGIANNTRTNLNTAQDLDLIVRRVHERLRELRPSPGVGLVAGPDRFNADIKADIEMAQDEAGNARITGIQGDLGRTLDAEDRQGLWINQYA
ncbi:Histone deacetylase superfamily [Carpediemonas membranifera]|uniref:Histone deacetylase n=1 Tax=Carpediemonas membranifera TaxID=201153 RepID=A0A8J6BAE0_9EUKA|nr:Histone deacetylase superfamily [Carpediemonas membranifera]|eukprot:KAG9393282.1 Histone deacetylase superfamily [Carpediemonas membranifera]